MKKKIGHWCDCGECTEKHYIDDGEQIVCDTCGKDIIEEKWGIPITINFGYGSELDGNEYHFDDLKCLLSFTLDEMKKENPENRFEYGKETK